MKLYLIVRYGSNAYNQSMCNRMVLGYVEAASAQPAYRAARERWNVYANQTLEAIPPSRQTKRDREAANEAEFCEAHELGGMFEVGAAGGL